MKKKFLVMLIILVGGVVFGSGFGDRITEVLKNNGINPYFIVFLISSIPIVELRGAIPIGILMLKLNWFPVILLSIAGNMMPVFFILYVFKILEKIFRKVPVFNKLIDIVFKITMKKSESIEKYEELGLMFFVGIPLPVTGAWTGSLISYILRLSYIKSIIFIFLGVVVASIIVSAITFYGIKGLIIAISLFVLITLTMGLVEYFVEKKKKSV